MLMKFRSRAFLSVTAALAAVVCLGVLTVAQTTSKSLPNPDSSNFKPFTQITKANVTQLQQAWFYPYASPTFSPVYARDVLYGFGRNNSAIVALDATTGKEIWVHDGLSGIQNKGMNYWESEDGSDRRLIFVLDSFMQEIDAKTGKTIPTFGVDGAVDMRKGLAWAEGTNARAMPASPGRIWKTTIVYGGQSGEQIMTPPGYIRGYDILTGKLLWTFHTQPLPGEFGYDTNPPDGYKYQGGANNWGEMAIDEERGIAYVPTGSSTADFWGGDRHGQNLFANCLLALDIRTGKRLWHFQTVHHDLWDLDNVSAPQLVTVTHNGQKVDVVAHAGKTGFLYVFNRVTGEPLWPIEERPVRTSTVPNELSWPTQPFPTKPPAFARQSYTEDDVNPYLLTKEEYEALKERVRKAITGTGPQGGLFNPTQLNGDSISMPGNQGGANWGTTAADPQKGMVFVTGVNQVAILTINDIEDPAVANGRRGGGGGRGGLNLSQVQTGQAKFTQLGCVACHGANLQGALPGVPSLVSVTDRLDEESVRVIVSEGRNNMRPILDATNEDIQAIYAYLTSMNPNAGRGGRGRIGGGGPLPPANVVATGGAPHPPIPPAYDGPVWPGVGGTTGNRLWPEGTEAAKTLKKRYQSGYNVMATSTKPPYTTITAYDLNTGDIKWQVPNGDDPATVDATTLKNGVCPPLRQGNANTPPSGPAAAGCTATGMHDTGGVGARNGMIVTAAGLLFQMGKDGWARAYDEDTGKVLWKGKVAGQSIGIPAMYESQGRQYVVFMSPPVEAGGAGGRAGGGNSAPPDNPTGPYGYIAFALPK
jgi:quinoprotein glucose dehydrogenase